MYDLLGNLQKMGICDSAKFDKIFLAYYELLIQWNEKMNLTAITEQSEVYCKHFLDSIAVCKTSAGRRFKQKARMIDVGTGAGFPGIPLKIVFPELQVTLLDSLNKRVHFLDEVIDTLQLSNIVALHSRAEDAAKDDKYREQYDICVSRAVANLATLAEYCLPFVAEGGLFIAYKSGAIEEELAAAKIAIQLLGGRKIVVEKMVLPDTDIERSFVLIEKGARTPTKYPRKAGLPSKEPLS